ncbi:MAG: hypothetical protein IJT05_01365 [Lachnospiraceae bacterium]|nr:hypothetical protein [Lachnospiraceae bacterium]
METGSSGNLGAALKQYTKRMREIRALSAPRLEGLNTAEAYSCVLKKNFENIGKLAGENRSFISEVLNPILESAEPLDDETIRLLQDANEELLDAAEGESIDLPIASLLAER